jgi:pectate lyase
VQKLTGGGNGPIVEVRTAAELLAAAQRSPGGKKAKKPARECAPMVIKVMADLDLGELGNERGGNELKQIGKVLVGSNTTIIAPGQGATLRHGILEMHGAHNVIIRNLKFRDLWENDPSEKFDRFGWDFLRITSSGKEFSHHIWVDHCDFGKCYDGQLDITHGSDLITVSWCHFSGDERGPHKKSMLIGHSSSANASAADSGRLNVTLHHNWFENIEDRAPRLRNGNVHIYNDFVDGATNATISVQRGVTLVENSLYRDTAIATSFSHAADTEQKGRGGIVAIVNSKNLAPRPPWGNLKEVEKFEFEHNFVPNVKREELRFNPPAEWVWGNLGALPYAYQPDPAESLPTMLKKYAGTGHVADSELARPSAVGINPSQRPRARWLEW